MVRWFPGGPRSRGAYSLSDRPMLSSRIRIARTSRKIPSSGYPRTKATRAIRISPTNRICDRIFMRPPMLWHDAPLKLHVVFQRAERNQQGLAQGQEERARPTVQY